MTRAMKEGNVHWWLTYQAVRAAHELTNSESAWSRRSDDAYLLPDERARQSAWKQLSADPTLDVSHVDIRVLSGELILTGRVASERLKADVEALCRGVAGVRTVRNELQVA